MTGAELGLLAGIAFVAFTIHAVTGFASMITAVVLASFWFSIAEIRPPFVALSVALNLYFVLRYRRDLALNILLRYVAPWMGGGTVLGYLVSGAVAGPELKRAFGVFVFVVATRELWRAWRQARGDGGALELSDKPPAPWLVAAGVIHGIYATGGPPLVYALSRVSLTKAQLRATLCAIWLSLNVGLTIAYLRDGTLAGDGWRAIAAMAPATVVAVIFGSWVHDRVQADRFRVAVFVLLIVASLGLVFA